MARVEFARKSYGPAVLTAGRDFRLFESRFFVERGMFLAAGAMCLAVSIYGISVELESIDVGSVLFLPIPVLGVLVGAWTMHWALAQTVSLTIRPHGIRFRRSGFFPIARSVLQSRSLEEVVTIVVHQGRMNSRGVTWPTYSI